MKLLTKEIEKAFEKQGYTGDKKCSEIKVICKFFNPTGAGTWYLYEYNPKDRIFMGYVNLLGADCAELGTVSLDELEQFKGLMGLGIERDIGFEIGKYTVQEIIDKIQSGEHV